MRLRLATRGSDLALLQTSLVRAALESVHPGIEVVVDVVRSTGDRITDAPLSSFGGAGVFTSELDRRVADGELDLAVHSLKDLPTVPSRGLRIVAILERSDPRDAYVPAPGSPRRLAELPRGAVVGTSSLRRRALLREMRPDLEVIDLRGNLDTRLERLREGRCHAAILAHAGLRRLQRDDVIGELLDAPPWLPAAGQGAIAVVARTSDDDIATAAAALDLPLAAPSRPSARFCVHYRAAARSRSARSRRTPAIACRCTVWSHRSTDEPCSATRSSTSQASPSFSESRSPKSCSAGGPRTSSPESVAHHP